MQTFARSSLCEVLSGNSLGVYAAQGPRSAVNLLYRELQFPRKSKHFDSLQIGCHLNSIDPVKSAGRSRLKNTLEARAEQIPFSAKRKARRARDWLRLLFAYTG